MTRILAGILCLIGMLTQPANANDADRVARALAELRAGDIGAAFDAAGEKKSIPWDIVEWQRLRSGGGTAKEVEEFLARRSDWPGLAWLRRKSEPAMAAAGTARILKFYAEHPPQTAEGVLSHAAALAETGKEGDAEAELVLAWRTMPMGRTIQNVYLDRHRKLLAPHHWARLDRLLWDGNFTSAKRMLPLVGKDRQALAAARIALHDMAPGVDTRIAAVPDALKSDPGLAHGRFVWRARKGRTDDAVKLLLARSKSAETLGFPEKWARRRLDLARRVMRSGDSALAYEIASRHHTTPDAGYVHADLEWLSGFLALRKLDDPATAVRHFKNFDAAVKSPISQGRAGYWLGRAYEALGDADKAHEAYAKGAGFQTSFYGLLAAERIGRPFDPVLAHPPAPPPLSESGFADSSVLKAGLMLIDAGELTLAEPFLTHLVESLDLQEADQLGHLIIEKEQPHLAVMIAKRAARQAVVLPMSYYPPHPVGEMKLPMAPEMTLAIARRESEFDPEVVSGAGARGLMQVMPKTARAVASGLGILGGHDTDRLTNEWRYNAKLGANYLAELAGDLGGNVVLVSAGYNAGPGRPLRWIDLFGDPRTDAVEIVDWIEFIPFDETRNYVMRVTESLPIYRARLGKDPLPIPFSEELAGSTLLSFSP